MATKKKNSNKNLLIGVGIVGGLLLLSKVAQTQPPFDPNAGTNTGGNTGGNFNWMELINTIVTGATNIFSATQAKKTGAAKGATAGQHGLNGIGCPCAKNAIGAAKSIHSIYI